MAYVTCAEPVRDMSTSKGWGPSASVPALPFGIASLTSDGYSSNLPTACIIPCISSCFVIWVKQYGGRGSVMPHRSPARSSYMIVSEQCRDRKVGSKAL